MLFYWEKWKGTKLQNRFFFQIESQWLTPNDPWVKAPLKVAITRCKINSWPVLNFCNDKGMFHNPYQGNYCIWKSRRLTSARILLHTLTKTCIHSPTLPTQCLQCTGCFFCVSQSWALWCCAAWIGTASTHCTLKPEQLREQRETLSPFSGLKN